MKAVLAEEEEEGGDAIGVAATISFLVRRDLVQGRRTLAGRCKGNQQPVVAASSAAARACASRIACSCAVTSAAVTACKRKSQTDKVLGSLAASRRETLAARKDSASRGGGGGGGGRGGGRQTVHNATFDPTAGNA